MARAVSGNFHIVGNCLDCGGVFIDGMEVPVGPEFPDGAAKGNLLGLGGFGEQPGGAQVLPVVRELHLLAFHDFLLKEAQLVADGVPGGGNLQGGHGVQVAGGQTAQAAVAQGRVGLHLEDVTGFEAQMVQGLLELGQQPQVVGVLHQAPAHEEFHGQVVDLLLLVLAGFLPGFHLPEGHHVPED